jgi:tetratricopeptide (TPR) repeat protein
MLEQELDSPTEALAEFNTAIALEPDMDDVYLERAGVLMELGRFKEALLDFTKVWLDEAYDSDDVLDYVECLIELDQLDQAIDLLYNSMETFPDVLQIRLVLAGYLFATDDLVNAKVVLEDTGLAAEEVRKLFAEYFPDLLHIPAVSAILANLNP